MPAVIVDIADAVVATLNAATLSQAFTAERLYVPIYEMNDSDLKVTVVPSALSSTLLNRGTRSLADYVIDVGIQKRLAVGKLTRAQIRSAVDPMLLLAQEIGDLFLGLPLATYLSAECVSIEQRVPYDPGLIDEKKAFMTVLSLTFRKPR
jgi:hypothetical protein